jgi:prepilin-type N-terminal cleavage/methylation domain-containing protein
MRSGLRELRLHARDEAGLTLIELTVVMALFAIVLGAVMGPMIFTQKQAPKDITYAQSISDATSGLQRMMREIRNAYKINATDGDPTSGAGSMIDFSAYLNDGSGSDQDYEVRYDCAQPSKTKTGYYACVRVAAKTGTALPAISTGAVIIDRVKSPNVFTFDGVNGTPDLIYPSYIQANVQVPAGGSLYNGLKHLITLNNGTALPNLQNGG